MKLFPAIDILDGKAVRLYKGDYNEVTVYNNSPLDVAIGFENDGADCLHIVDLEGARKGEPVCLDIISSIAQQTRLFIEVGGGVRDMKTVEALLSHGVSRVILGTAALENESFLREAVSRFGDSIAVGADLRDGFVAVRGWTQVSNTSADTFFERMQSLSVSNVICTDISKDGAMAGTNLQLYSQLSSRFGMKLTASGGVSTLEDIKRLSAMNIYAAILGKALYTGAFSLKEALALV